MFKLDVEKAEETENKHCQHLLDHIKSKRIPEKKIYFGFIDYVKAFDCVDHNKLWKTLQRDGNTRPPYMLLKILYAGQEAKVRTGRGTTDWF